MALPAERTDDVRQASQAGLRRRLLRSPAALVLIADLTLAVLLFARTWVQPGTTVAGVGGDPQIFVWTYRWVPFALSHGINPLFSNYVDYPAGMNLMWQGTGALIGLLLSPVTMLWGPVVAYNLAATLAPAVSAWGAFLAMRRYVHRWPAAAVGGLLYGFSPGMIAQASAGHVHLTLAIFPPLALLLADEILVRRRWHPAISGALLGGLAGLQVLVSEEMLLLTVIAGVVAVLVVVALHRRPSAYEWSAVVAASLAACAAFFAVAALPLAEQFLGPQRLHGVLQPQNFYVSDLFNFVIPSPLQVLSPSAINWLSGHFTGDASSRDAYLGLPLIAWFVIQAWRRWADPVVRWSALLALVLATLSLGPALHVAGVVTHIPMPWAVLQPLPVLENVLPGRLMLIAFLPAGILLARALDALFERRWSRSSVLIPAISLLLLVPNLEPAVATSTPGFFQSPAWQRLPAGSVVLVAPFSSLYSTDAMQWQAVSGMRFRMPEGYGFVPGSLLNVPASPLPQAMVDVQVNGTTPQLTPEVLSGMRRQLSDWHVQAVIVGPMPHAEVMVKLLTAVMGEAPAREDGVAVWLHIPGGISP